MTADLTRELAILLLLFGLGLTAILFAAALDTEPRQVPA